MLHAKKSRSVALAVAGSLILSASLSLSPALADGKVLAKVNGIDVTDTDVKLAQSEIGPNLGDMPADQRLSILVEYLIQNKLMAAAADKAGLGSDASMPARIEYYKGRALRDLYFDKNIQGAVTETDAKALYDKQVAAIKPVEEIHASHILVEKKEEADDIVAKLKAGGDFAALAKEKSKDSGSGANGGDLGFFKKGDMVKPFEDAANALKPGDISAPVQSQFGWHVIKLIEKRNRPAPPFDSVKDRILNSLLQQKAQEVIGSMHKQAKIDYIDETLKKAAAAPAQ